MRGKSQMAKPACASVNARQMAAPVRRPAAARATGLSARRASSAFPMASPSATGRAAWKEACRYGDLYILLSGLTDPFDICTSHFAVQDFLTWTIPGFMRETDLTHNLHGSANLPHLLSSWQCLTRCVTPFSAKPFESRCAHLCASTCVECCF